MGTSQTNTPWKNQSLFSLNSLAASQLVYVLSPLKTNQIATTEINQLIQNFLWNGKGDKIKRNVIIGDYRWRAENA